MSRLDGGQPSVVEGTQLPTHDFPPLPSTNNRTRTNINHSFPTELSFSSTIIQPLMHPQSNESLREEITVVGGFLKSNGQRMRCSEGEAATAKEGVDVLPVRDSISKSPYAARVSVTQQNDNINHQNGDAFIEKEDKGTEKGGEQEVPEVSRAKVEGSTEEKSADNLSSSECNEEQIFKDVDLSPRIVKVVKSARKGKKQGSGEAAKPVRVQPKRHVTIQQSKSQRRL
ncbi:hypothetical protein HAX54_035340 [Datura stramonium]|uniref:Uncharacterized protein n=1 Tax=Datura stramonium TaxID=4076 RepID=A0ABS8SFE4_DATST|nr:hypothetical protein [Datura stramonium]